MNIQQEQIIVLLLSHQAPQERLDTSKGREQPLNSEQLQAVDSSVRANLSRPQSEV